jgi:predicted NBD/HSP70 family sugar kinase
MSLTSHIGIDLGGTNIRAAILQENSLVNMVSQRIDPMSSAENMIRQLLISLIHF